MSYKKRKASPPNNQLNEKQRTEMIDKLLAISKNNQQQFKHRAATASSSTRSIGSNDSVTKQHIDYIQRLNAVLPDEDVTLGESRARRFIFLPPFGSSNVEDKAEFSQILHNFFLPESPGNAADFLLYNVDHFVYYLLDYVFSSTKNDRRKKDPLINIAMALHSVSKQFFQTVAAVFFDQVAHQYYVNGKKMDLSVTQSLDQLFGTFNQDEAARSMIRSRNWQRNALFKAINYDESGNQRDEDTMRSLIKKEWQTRCNRGTILHEFIHNSLTAGGNLCIINPFAGEKEKNVTPDNSVNPPFDLLPEPMTVKNYLENENPGVEPIMIVDKAIETAGDGGDLVLNPLSTQSEAFSLWTTLRAHFVQKLPCNTASDNGNVNSRHGTSVASVNLLDNANVSAFGSWNRLRVNEHWLLLASEYAVYDELSGLAGTIDGIFIPYPDHPNMIVLVDWKRCEIDFGTRYYGFKDRYQHPYVNRYPKCNYWKYAFQLNLYREILERVHAGRLIVLDMMIVNFLPDSQFTRTFSVPRIPEARLFLDDLRKRKRNENIVNASSEK